MKGRKPTPTKILENRESWHANTARRKKEPRPDVEQIRCPSWLKGMARDMWITMSSLLFDIGILTLIDKNALARYCRLWARWRECEKHIAENGESFEVFNKDGKVSSYRLYPESRMALSLASELRNLEAEFGLTPSSRSRIDLEKGNHVDEITSKAKYFEQRG